MKQKVIAWLLFVTIVAFAKDPVIVSPNGGEIFSAGQDVTIQWQGDTAITEIALSIDSGESWSRVAWMMPSSPGSYRWAVPFFKKETRKALVKVTVNGKTDLSDGTFTIKAAAPDAYEPNDNFASAYYVPLGDSVVRNAMIIPGDTMGGDTAITDVDVFKVHLDGGKIVTISFFDETASNGFLAGPASVCLYDPSKNLLAQTMFGNGFLMSPISQSGVYYCQIASKDKGFGREYGLSINQVENGMALIAPNGGEGFVAGQKVTIRWTKSPLINGVRLLYSRDNGASWRNLTYTTADMFVWSVPALYERTDRALIKVESVDYDTSAFFDVTNGTFTIQAAPPDAYEPNDDFASAYPVGIGDSVVKEATFGIYDNVDNETFSDDTDYYKVRLSAGSLVVITPWSRSVFNSNDGFPSIELFDDAKNTVGFYNYSLIANVEKTGIYYCRILLQAGRWMEYGMSINAITPLASQKSVIETTSMTDTAIAGNTATFYKVHIIADATKLGLDLVFDEKKKDSITIVTLAPEEIVFAQEVPINVKLIAVIPGSGWQRDLTITIPYTHSDLNGFPEASLLAAQMNFGSKNEWMWIRSTVDTVKHQIKVPMGPVFKGEMLAVYSKASSKVTSIAATPASHPGITAKYLAKQHAVAVNFNLQKATAAELMLYDMQGRCVRRSTFAMGSGSRMHLWSMGSLVNGRYLLSVKAGTYYARESMLIMN